MALGIPNGYLKYLNPCSWIDDHPHFMNPCSWIKDPKILGKLPVTFLTMTHV